MITATMLLAQVDPLSPGGRAHQVITVARELAVQDPAGLDRLLDEFAEGSAHARRLGVLMAGVTGRGDRLATAAGDPDPAVAAAAVHTRGVPDDVLRTVLLGGSLQLRRTAYRRVVADRRTGLAVALFEPLRARWGDREAVDLLPALDAGTVTAVLPELAPLVRGWSTLVRRHPEPVARFARAELAALSQASAGAWWGERAALVDALVQIRPEVVLEWVEQHPQAVVVGTVQRHLGRLLAVDPGRVAAVLLAARSWAALQSSLRTRNGRRRLAALDDATLATLIRDTADRTEILLPILLGALPPSRRERVFDLFRTGQDLSALMVSDPELALLPAARRHAEATRMLSLPEIARSRPRLRTVAAHLPAGRARAVLDADLTGPDPDGRALAYRLLVRNAGRECDPEQAVELLTWLGRIRNERDPVRATVLAAVAELPFRLLVPAAVPAMDRLVRDALDARDCSGHTRHAIVELAFRVLWQSAARVQDQPLAAWALETIQAVGGWGGQAALAGAEQFRGLRRGQELEIWRHLRLPFEQALERNDAWPLLTLARLLGRRAWPIDELQDLIGSATRIRDDAVVREAVRLWLEPPATRADRVGQLVRHDPSMITLDPVLHTVITRRTDLLESLVLSGRPLTGRLGALTAGWVPLIEPAVVRRWNPAQQARYADLLAAALADPGQPRMSRAGLTRTLAATPAGGPAAVQHLIGGDDELVAEAALTGLGSAARPDRAVPVLLAATEGDRARVAVFALTQLARRVTPAALGELVLPLLATTPRITVRKELVRLVALTRPVGAPDALLAAWAHPDQHRDVRVALVAALITVLPDPRAAQALARAAADPDPPVAAAVLGAGPHDLPPAARPGYVQLIRVVTRQADGPTAMAALAALAGWFQWAPDAGAELHHRVLDLDRVDVWTAAAASAADPRVWSVDPGLPAALVAALAARLDEGPDAGAVRDLPALRRIDVLVERLVGHTDAVRREPDAALRLAAELSRHERLAPAAARLLVLLADPAEGPPGRLESAADLLRGRPVAAAAVAGALSARSWAQPSAAAGAAATAARLAARGEPAAGLLAVAVVALAGARSGWAPDWRERLRALRAHPAPDVRDAADAVRTARE